MYRRLDWANCTDCSRVNAFSGRAGCVDSQAHAGPLGDDVVRGSCRPKSLNKMALNAMPVRQRMRSANGSRPNSDVLLIAAIGTVDITATDVTDCGIGRNGLICCEPTREKVAAATAVRVFSSLLLTGGRKP